MKIRKFAVCGAIAVALSFSFDAPVDKSVYAETVENNKPQITLSAPIYDRYEVGEVITLPNATVNGKQTTLSIVDPLGNPVHNGFTPSISGCKEYVATYTTTVDGVKYSYEYPFAVSVPQVSVSGKGTVELTSYPYLESLNDLTYENVAKLKDLYSEGALFTAYAGDKIRIEGQTLLDDMKVVKNTSGNLSVRAICDEADSNQRILSFGWCPSDGYGKTTGKTDFSAMYIKAVNAFDEKEYVTFKVTTEVDKCYVVMTEQNGETVDAKRQWINSVASSQSSSGDLHFSLFYESEAQTWYAARIDSAYGWTASPVGVSEKHMSRVNFEIWFENYTNVSVPAQIFVNALRGEHCRDVYYDDMHELEEHAAQSPTCDGNGNRTYWSCIICEKIFSDGQAIRESTLSETLISPTGHVWRSATCSTPKTCVICGDSVGDPQHKYANSCDPDCDYCGEERTVDKHKDKNSDGYCDECSAMLSTNSTSANSGCSGELSVPLFALPFMGLISLKKKKSKR